jgi:hypothetical protein
MPPHASTTPSTPSHPDGAHSAFVDPLELLLPDPQPVISNGTASRTKIGQALIAQSNQQLPKDPHELTILLPL